MGAGGTATATYTITAAFLQAKNDGVVSDIIPWSAMPAHVLRGIYASGARFDHEDDQPLTIRIGHDGDTDALVADTNICDGGTVVDPLTPGDAGGFGGAFPALAAGFMKLRITSSVNLNQYTGGPVTLTYCYDVLPGSPLSDSE